MEKQEIVNKITPIFRKVFADDSLVITDTMTAGDVAKWDSLTHMVLIDEIETALNIKFKLKELNKMKNVGEMIDIILSKM